MSKEKQTYNPCDDCQYSYSKNAQESGMCKKCEFTYFKDRKQSENVIELPCKIGDTVYVVSQGAGFSVAWRVYKSTVRAIHLDRYNKLFIHTETDKENIGGYVEVERVFNTKEEAEQALEKIIEKMKGGAE